MAGVVPPLDTTGDVPVTDVTPPGDPLAAAVIKPLALTVMLAFVNAPTLLLTVARVEALPTEVTSPVKLALIVAVPVALPVPPLAIGKAEPDRPIANVPLVVIGEPVTDKNAGTVAATLVTVPEPPPALIV